jgi:hypothetical protein
MKVLWSDRHVVRLSSGRAVFEEQDDVIYLAMALRNADAGIALMHGRYPWPSWQTGRAAPVDPARFRRLTIDLYVPPGDANRRPEPIQLA